MNTADVSNIKKNVILFFSIFFFLLNFFQVLASHSSQKEIRDNEYDLVNFLSTSQDILYFNENTEYQSSICKSLNNKCLF